MKLPTLSQCARVAAFSLAIIGTAKAAYFYVLLWPWNNDNFSLFLAALVLALVARALRVPRDP